MNPINLSMTPEQARSVCEALDVFVSLNLGKLDDLALLIRQGMIPIHPARQACGTQQDIHDEFAESVDQIKGLIGFSRTGSLGIGSPAVSINAHRAYEVLKVLSRATAEHRNPHPILRGIEYDGLTVRYTQDPAPTASARPSDLQFHGHEIRLVKSDSGEPSSWVACDAQAAKLLAQRPEYEVREVFVRKVTIPANKSPNF